MLIVYGDYECPFCAALEPGWRAPDAVAFRHFPVRSHPRAFAAACAAEAAALQDAFWPMHDALFADQGRLEDPHLWARATRLGLDVARFDADRRSDAVAARVRAQFRGGLRAGVPDHADPVLGGRAPRRPPGPELLARLANRAALSARIPARARATRRAAAADAALVDRLATDETGEAMRELYRLYGGELFGFALNALGDRGAAEEIVQEVFLRAWRHAGALRPAEGGGPDLAVPDHTPRDHRRAPPRLRPPGAAAPRARGRHRGRPDARAVDARLAGRRGARAAHARSTGR